MWPSGTGNSGNGLSTFAQLQVAAVDELHRARADVRVVGEETMHLVGRLDVELLRIELEAVRIVHAACGLHAEQNLVSARVVVSDVVAVVGRDQRNVKLALHLVERLADRLVGLQAVVLNLEKEVALAEHLLEAAGGLLRLVVLPCHQVLVHLARETAGEADKALGVARKKFFRHARLAIEAMQRGLAGQADEVAVALFVFGEHQEVVVAARHLAMIVGLGEIELAAEDRLDVLLLHRVEEVHRAVDVAVVGHGRGGLADLVQVRGQFIDVAGSIEKRVIRMQMEVGKLGGHTSMLSPRRW